MVQGSGPVTPSHVSVSRDERIRENRCRQSLKNGCGRRRALVTSPMALNGKRQGSLVKPPSLSEVFSSLSSLLVGSGSQSSSNASPGGPSLAASGSTMTTRSSTENAGSATMTIRKTSVEMSSIHLSIGSNRDGGSGAAKRSSVQGPPAFATASGRIIAIGDIHGDLQKAISCLELAGVLAEDTDGGVRWVGGDTTVVQLGDVLDRGDSEIATVLLLRELDRQARRYGGAVWMLNGNHESLNVAGDFRYVTAGAFWESAIAAGMTEADIANNQEGVLRARWFMYRPGGQMARELAKNPTVLVVNDIVFAHGGLLPHHINYGLQRMNDEVCKWMSGWQGTDGSSPAPPFPAMGDGNSVMWNRTFGKERVSPYDRIQMKMQLDKTLNKLGATAMVVGHTPQMGGVNAECDGRVWRADAGMSSGVLNADAQVLEFSRDSEGRLQARHLRADRSGKPTASRYVVYEGSQHKNGSLQCHEPIQEDAEAAARAA